MRACAALVLAVLLGACGGSGPPPGREAQDPDREGPVEALFTEVGRVSGIVFRHEAGDPVNKRMIYESNSAGLAWLDFDGDGLQDLYLVNSGHRLRSTPPPPDERTSGALFRNEGGGRFRDVTREAGLEDWRWGMGAAVADYDNDGDPDLYVTHIGPNALWRNNGDGTFTDWASECGVADAGPGSGAAFGDIDGDGHLDLYVANYVQVTADLPLPGNDELCRYRGVPVYCGPKGLPMAPDRLYRNRGDGTYVDVTGPSGVGDVSPRHSYDVVFLDVEQDGDADIYVAVDMGPSMLFVGDGRGHFAERAAFAGVGLAEAGTTQAGMGVDVADWDGDGLPDIAKSNFEGEVFNLYVNSASGLFTDHAHQTGLGRTMPALGWGTIFFDADRDGWLDLFFANGHVFPLVESGPLQLDYAQENLLFLTRREASGRLVLEDVSARAGPGLALRKVSRGVAVADYDRDGDLDLAINNTDDAADLLRNDSPALGGWLAVHVEGTRSNRDGYGARVRVLAGGRAQVREIRASRGYLSSSEPDAFFGLGRAGRIDRLEVTWPSGLRERFPAPEPDQRVTVREGDGEPL